MNAIKQVGLWLLTAMAVGASGRRARRVRRWRHRRHGRLVDEHHHHDHDHHDDDRHGRSGRTARGSGAAGGQGGTGGNQGGGGSGGCATAADCPDMATECQTPTCTEGVCGLDFAPDGTVTPTQDPGTCKQIQCDGQGSTKLVDDPSNVLDDSNPCTEDTCEAGAPVNTPSPINTPCVDGGSGLLCNGNGLCVECNSNDQCTSLLCQGTTCAPGDCANGMKDGLETDADCGGPCAPCLDNKGCAVAADCFSQVCVGNLCKPATCSDAIKNGGETDVDCGGPCGRPVRAGKGCAVNGDCIGGLLRRRLPPDLHGQAEEQRRDRRGLRRPDLRQVPHGQALHGRRATARARSARAAPAPAPTCFDGEEPGRERRGLRRPLRALHRRARSARSTPTA
jgi:hypothetical protein